MGQSLILAWWRCPWCHHVTATHHTEAEVITDRDRHIATAHPSVVFWAAHYLTISHYTFTEVHA